MSGTILVLEDDLELLQALLWALEDEDYQAEGASSGQQALAVGARRRLDVAVADVRMKGPDGIEVLRQLKSSQPALGCVVMTGFAGDDAPERALRIQVDDYLYKPFDSRDLMRSIQRLRQRAQEATRYDQLFSQVLAGYGDMLTRCRQPQRASHLAHVDQVRHACFRSYYVRIRSGRLEGPDGILVWDLLEQAELKREETMNDPGAELEDFRRLYNGYRQLGELLLALNQSHLSERARGPQQVTPQAFSRFHQLIRSGELSLEVVKTAARLRRADPVALATNPEIRALRQLLWPSE